MSMHPSELVICPRCKGNRTLRISAYHVGDCPTCEGGGRVELAVADDYLRSHGPKPTPPPPKPEDWDSSDEVTMVPCPACRNCYRCKGTHVVAANSGNLKP